MRVEEKDMMKKIITIVTLCCFVSAFATTVYAREPMNIADSIWKGEVTEEYSLKDLSPYTGFDDFAGTVKYYTLGYYLLNRNRRICTISSLDNHQNLKFQVFENGNEDAYNQIVSALDERTDFIQVITTLPSGILVSAREEFERNPKEAAANFLVPSNVDTKELKAVLAENNVPIYWNIEENIELGVGTIEIAIGKYIIQPGDTLSEIANAYETSVEQLLEDNQNIKDPNLIWAYDYLVINPY